MERTQKEYYLREQMKAIQTELGDREGKLEKLQNYGSVSTKLVCQKQQRKQRLKELDRYEKYLELVLRAVLFAIILIGLFHYRGQMLQRIA